MRLALLAAAVLATSVAAQTPGPEARRVEGRVVLMGGGETLPVADAWVTLHRVGPDSSGPLDSLRTSANGAFTIRYRAFGSSDALYFVSTRRGGVAYFTPPLRAALVQGDDAEIAVFDTTSARVPITVRGRHLIVSAADASGSRTVIEVFELSNDSSLTAIEREGTTTGVWSTPIPAAARDFQVRAGEVPGDALVQAGARAVLRLPLAPGLKQVAFSYALPAGAFPITLAAEAPTTVIEVLLEDQRGTVKGGRLVAVEPVLVEGRTFARFLAQDVPQGTSIVVDVPATQPAWVRWIMPGLLVLVGAAMLAALGIAWRRRPVASVAAPVAPSPSADARADALARQIAALDDAFEATTAPDDAARASYARRRGELKAQLADVLAARSTDR